MKKRLLSLAMSLILLFSLMPAISGGVSAADTVTAYVTMSFGDEIIRNSENNNDFIAVAVSVPIGSTAQTAIEAAVNAVGYASSPFAYSSYGSDVYFSRYSGNPYDADYDLGSAVSLNGTVAASGTVSGQLTADSTIDVALFSYTVGYPAKALYFGDASGNYASQPSVTVGGAAPVSVFSKDAVLEYGYFSSYGNLSGGTAATDVAVTYYTCTDGVYTPTATPFAAAGTVYAVATADGCVPAAAILAVSPMTIYITASYMDEVLEATEYGSAGASVNGLSMLCVPVELPLAGATVKDALAALAQRYCNSTYTFPASYPDSDYLTAVADYWGVATIHSLSSVSSYVMVNGVEAPYGDLTGAVADGDHILADMGSYDLDYNPQMTPTCIADTGGSYLGYRELQTGSSLSFRVGSYPYSADSWSFIPGGTVSSGCAVYVTDDLSNFGSQLTAVSGVYSYTFSSPGTYYIVAVDSDAAVDSTCYCASAEKIVVKDTVINAAPTLKVGIPLAVAVSTYAGKPYTLDLSSIFRDSNGDALIYSAKVNSGSFSAVSGSSYSCTPAAAGTCVLTFMASDGSADSGTYTVTLTVTSAPAYTAALSGLSDYYADLTSYTDSNDQWGIADLMAYNPAKLTAAQKAAVLEQLIADAYEAYTDTQDLEEDDTSGANACAAKLARCIVAMKSLGYDARDVKAGDGTAFNAVTAMNDLIGLVNSYSYGIYTQPYMLIALQEFGSAYTAEITALKAQLMAAALASGGWGSEGTLNADTFAPVVLALSPYTSETATYPDSAAAQKTIGEEIDACTSTAVIRAMQSDTGSIYSWGSDNVYSTGIVIAALVSVGKDPAAYTKNGKSLLDGLMLYYDAASCFGNPGANDQAFRGLVAYENLASGSRFALYDFTDHASLPAYSKLSFSDCPLYFSLIPSGAGVTVTDSGSGTAVPLSAGVYDLPAGDYTYCVSAGGYTTKTGTFTVPEGDAENNTRRTISVSLASAPTTSSSITVAFSIKAPANNNGTYTYKHNPSVYTNMATDTLALPSGSTAFDALDAGCTAAAIPYTEGPYGYVPMINGISQFDFGSKSGWLYKVDSTVPTTNCRDYILTSNCAVTWFYTDDYTNEYGSENWSAPSSASSEFSVAGTLNERTGAASAALSGAELTAFIDAVAAKDDAGGSEVPITVTTPDGTTAVSLTIPQGAVSALASTSNTSFTLDTAVGSMTFDPAALDGISGVSGGNDVTLSISKLDSSSLGEENKALVGNHPVYDLSITAGDRKITDFGNGVVKVQIPYTPRSGEDTSKLTVYYINSDGKATEMEGAHYDAASGCLIFTTNHFSKFAVIYNAAVSFADVGESDWFYNAVRYVSQHDLMSGTSAAAFEPGADMTRAMLVTVLYRMEGKSAVTGENSFSDVESGQWYTQAVLWADRNNIATGYGGGLFGTNESVTREQMAAILYRYAQYKGYDVSKTADLGVYADATEISTWAETAMQWANAEGLLTGLTASALAPAGHATRAQVATILMRFLETIVNS